MNGFADEHAVRCLAYVAAVTRAGAHLTSTQLDRFNNQAPPVRRSPLMPLLLSTVPPRSSMAGYLLQMDWVAPGSSGGLVLTDLGAAVLTAHTTEADEGVASDAFELVIRPDVPLDYARLYERISGFTGALLVDAYLATEALHFFEGMVALERILIAGRGVGGKDWKARRKDLENTLGLMGAHPDVRFLPHPRKDLHDRYVLPSNGEGLLLGGSIGGRQPSAVVRLTPQFTSSIREYHEGIWEESEPLKPTVAPAN